MRPSGGVLLATALLLGACATGGRDGPGTALPLPETQEQAPQQAAAPMAPPAAAETKPQRRFPPPAVLDGLEASRVLDLLGAPPFKRRDDPAMIWQYRTPLCALDLFLYRDRAGGAYRVRHFETRNRGKTAVSAKDCFAALITAKERGISG